MRLSAGKLITTPPLTSLHSRITAKIFTVLEGRLGRLQSSKAFCHAGYVLGRDPLTIRQPDISVLNKERIRRTGADEYFEGAPELAVEIVSPSDSAEDLQMKVHQYLGAGAKQVWVVYPKTKRVHLFYADGQTASFDETQALTEEICCLSFG